jgi:reductive dehalogenase
MTKEDTNKDVSRRQFLKASGATGAVVGGAGLGLFGYSAGKDPNTYLGWQTYEGVNQSFDRSKWEVDQPHYERVGPTSRVDARTENIFNRRSRFRRQYRTSGVDGFDDLLEAYYREHPEDLRLDIEDIEEIMPKAREDRREYGHKFLLAEAWSNAMGAVGPRLSSDPPEIADFPRRRGRFGDEAQTLKMKDPEMTSKLLKKISHELGSTLVGITKLNPDWVYLYPQPGRGLEVDQPLEVPKHWEYAVVVGTPMSWDPLYANPTYGTSNDAYSRSRIVAARVASFIKTLGYAARIHIPGNSYDLMVPPICVDAGLGEHGRHGVVITPELGCNFRPAIVTTNLPLKPDRPIDIGVQSFCQTCKICAENCPSGAITMGDKVVVRGYRRYQLKIAKCLNMWGSTLGSMGCRICIAVCPYTRKANWLHRTAFKASLHDPTGLADVALTGLQERLYPKPDPQDYYIPSLGGKNASYREPPWWLVAEDFIDF